MRAAVRRLAAARPMRRRLHEPSGPASSETDRRGGAREHGLRPADESVAMDGPGWAPLNFTFARFWEIDPAWVEEHGAGLRIVDVREPDRFAGPLGHVVGARLLPLGDLEKRAGDLAKDRSIVTVCRSGARSAQAATILKKAAFGNVANLAGGCAAPSRSFKGTRNWPSAHRRQRRQIRKLAQKGTGECVHASVNGRARASASVAAHQPSQALRPGRRRQRLSSPLHRA